MLRSPLTRTIFIYFLGIVTGAQLTLYIFDYTEDGEAETKSLLIGIGLLLLCLSYIFYTFRARKKASDSA